MAYLYQNIITKSKIEASLANELSTKQGEHSEQKPRRNSVFGKLLSLEGRNNYFDDVVTIPL